MSCRHGPAQADTDEPARSYTDQPVPSLVLGNFSPSALDTSTLSCALNDFCSGDSTYIFHSILLYGCFLVNFPFLSLNFACYIAISGLEISSSGGIDWILSEMQKSDNPI